MYVKVSAPTRSQCCRLCRHIPGVGEVCRCLTAYRNVEWLENLQLQPAQQTSGPLGKLLYFISFPGSDPILCVTQNATYFLVAARNASVSTTVSTHHRSQVQLDLHQVLTGTKAGLTFLVSLQNLKDVLADLIPKEQNRIKNFKQQYGKTNIGQITVDMVGCFLGGRPQCVIDDTPSVLVLMGHVTFYPCLLPQVYGGMRGMKGLVYETSVLDPDEVGVSSCCGSLD